ncbi:hypothetical protein [Actinoallomurus vinaceus]
MLRTLTAGAVAATALTVGTALPASATTSNFYDFFSGDYYGFSREYHKTTSPKNIWLRVTYLKKQKPGGNAYVRVVKCNAARTPLGSWKYNLKVGGNYRLTTKTIKKGTCFQIELGQGYGGTIKGKLSY